MIIDKKYLLEKVVSDDTTRTALHHVGIAKHKHNPVAFASNGRKLVRVPVQLENDTELGTMAAGTLTKARKLGRKYDQLCIGLTPENALLGDGSHDIRPEDKFPSDSAIRILEDALHGAAEYTVALDAKLLFEIAQAIGAGNRAGQHVVTLEFRDPLNPVVVRCDQSPEAIGVLSTARIGGAR